MTEGRIRSAGREHQRVARAGDSRADTTRIHDIGMRSQW